MCHEKIVPIVPHAEEAQLVDLDNHRTMPCGWFERTPRRISRGHNRFDGPDGRLLPLGSIGLQFSRPGPSCILGSPDRLPGSVSELALLGARGRNICSCSLRILPDGPDSLASPRKSHGADEPGFDLADVSYAAHAKKYVTWTPATGCRGGFCLLEGLTLPARTRGGKFKLTKPTTT